jgi:hypothetical protein
MLDAVTPCRLHTAPDANKETFKVWQPRRAARSKQPNTLPADGTKTEGAETHPEAEVLPTTIT